MVVSTRKSFDKSFARLSDRQLALVEASLASFMADPFAHSLRNHALKGKDFAGVRSIDA